MNLISSLIDMSILIKRHWSRFQQVDKKSAIDIMEAIVQVLEAEVFGTIQQELSQAPFTFHPFPLFGRVRSRDHPI